MSDFGQQMMKSEAVLEEEWVFANSTDSPAWGQANERQHSAEVTLFDCSWLTAEAVDSLADYQQDWIGMLQPDWELELYNLNLLGIKGYKRLPESFPFIRCRPGFFNSQSATSTSGYLPPGALGLYLLPTDCWVR